MSEQYINFGGETVEQHEVVKYYFKNATVEIHGIDAADCREALEHRIKDPHELNHDVFMYTPKLAGQSNKQKVL
ncbi:hypothetical protein KY317_02780 [Candidatus Woesearchaeota archaeon]|nr:hypothetical protein [Candidatus Woesearchaeota archaeon]